MIQLQVLNYILDKKDSSFITLNNLTEDFFPQYKDEFNFIKEHLNTFGVICDKESFLSKFPNFEIIDVQEPPEYLLTNLFDNYNRSKLVITFNSVKDYLNKGKTSEALNILTSAYENLSSGKSLSCVDIIKDTSRYSKYVEKSQDFNKFYITTGFKELDDIVGGFDRNEELATIVARTNFGKSWVLLKCASAACEIGLNVGYYSGEMSEDKVGDRLDTLLGHIPNTSITHGNINIQNEYKEFIDNGLSKVKGSLKVLTPKMINGPATVDALRAFIEKENLDALYIDQLSLLEDQRKGRTTTDKMSNISKDLKNLQVIKRIPIISVCQQNRTINEDKSIDTTQIAQSDRIGQDATMIIFLDRDKKDPSILRLILGKSRDSANGKTITYNVDFNMGRFTCVHDDENTSNDSDTNEYTDRYTPTYDDGCGNREDSF